METGALHAPNVSEQTGFSVPPARERFYDTLVMRGLGGEAIDPSDPVLMEESTVNPNHQLPALPHPNELTRYDSREGNMALFTHEIVYPRMGFETALPHKTAALSLSGLHRAIEKASELARAARAYAEHMGAAAVGSMVRIVTHH